MLCLTELSDNHSWHDGRLRMGRPAIKSSQYTMKLQMQHLAKPVELYPNQLEPQTPPSHAEVPDTPLVKELRDQLRRGNSSDAVRLFLRAIADAALPTGELRAATFQVFGTDLMQEIIHACANLDCPFCKGGFVTCLRCEGTGRTDNTLACRSCRSLGAMRCDFCGGSGFAGYSFIPQELQADVALVRFEHASTMVSDSEQTLSTLSSQHEHPLRNSLTTYCHLARVHAIMANVLDLVRSGIDQPHDDTARLLARCWRGLAQVEEKLSQSIRSFVALSRAKSPQHVDDGGFENDRSSLLEEEALRFATSAKDRHVHMQNCSQRCVQSNSSKHDE